MTFKRTIFEAAVSYVRDHEERLNHRVLIQMVIISQGVQITAISRDNDRINQSLVSWHNIEQGLYDALRIGIDRAAQGF